MLLAFLACVDDPDSGPDEAPPGADDPTIIPGNPDDPDPGTLPGDTDPDDDPPDTDGDTGADDGQSYAGADFLFGLDMVHSVDILLSEESLDQLNRNPYDYVEGSVSIDGETVESVGVRLKGSGSFQNLRGKAAFKIDFNAFVEDQEFHGLGKMTLNNMNHDESKVREYVAYSAFGAAGLPTMRVGYAWVTLNDEAYGLYSHVETTSKGWMDLNFGTREGRVYEGGYPLYPASYDHADFRPNEARNFDLEVGDDVGNEDVVAAAEQVSDNADDWDGRVDEVIDLDQYARFHVTEAWVGQWDGYAFASASNNYRVWVDEDDRVSFVPSGMDYTFLSYASDWRRGNAPVASGCSRDEACAARQVAAAVEVCAAIDAADLQSLREEAWGLVQSYAEEDPRNSTTANRMARAQEDTDEWIAGRSTEILRLYEE